MSKQKNRLPRAMRQGGIQAKKSLGQNFLTDQAILQRIVRAAGITRADAVLEIGAGTGSLTRELAAAAGQVTAVEIDGRLFPILEESLGANQNVKLVHADILKFDPQAAGLPEGYIVAANIPYYITSAIIRHLLEAAVKPRRIVLTVQEQVAGRIVAVPDDMNLLALSVQVYGKPSIEFKIPASAFKPVPEVDSAVVRIELHPQALIPAGQLDLFFHLAKAGFSQKRKTLRNSISAGMRVETREAEQILAACGIDPKRRAETISMDEWVKLTQAWNSIL